MQHLAGSARRFEIVAAVVPQTEIQTFSDRGLLDHVRVTFELVADCGSDEIGTVRVEPFLDHKIDVTKVDITKIDRDFFGVCGLWSEFVNIAGHDFYHPCNICVDGIWMSAGSFQDVR